ncbi:MAG: glycosidase [Firmicutes bacterium]|nr:glycosidase [Bacillota bacterium]
MSNLQDAEHLFEHTMAEHLAELARYCEVDIVIGVPFYNEEKEIGPAIEALQSGLEKYCPECRALIVCVGSAAGHRALEKLAESKAVSGKPEVYTFLLDHDELLGKGWGVKALLKVAAALHADLALFEADFLASVGEVDSYQWLRLLLDPIRIDGYDLSLGCFERHPFTDGLALHLVSPIIASTYGWHITDPLGDEMALSNDLVNRLISKSVNWFEDAYQYGVGIWILTTALAQEARICESSLGAKAPTRYNGKRELMGHQIIRTLFHQVKEHFPKWSKTGTVLRFPDAIGVAKCASVIADKPDFAAALRKFQKGFNASTANLLKRIIPSETFAKLNFLAEAPREHFHFNDSLWAEVVYDLLLGSAFHSELDEDDLINAALSLLHGRRAHTAKHLAEIEQRLGTISADETNLLSLVISQESSRQIRLFHQKREELIKAWQEQEEKIQPFLPQVAFWEFIPGVAMTLPQEVSSSKGKTISLIPIYEALLREYRQRFASFVEERFGLPVTAPSSKLVEAITGFMRSLEEGVKEHFLTANFTLYEGTKANAKILFDFFDPGEIYALKDEAAWRFLYENPPAHLLTKYNSSSVAELREKMPPHHILALSFCTEHREYQMRLWEWLRKNVRPEDFENRPLEPLVVPNTLFYGPSEMRETTKLCRLAGTLVLTNLTKHAGGEYRSLRYLTAVGKSIFEALAFSEIWRGFAKEGSKQFARKVANSLEGHWGNALFSAHNIFESGIHRKFASQLRERALALKAASQDPEFQRFCADLALAAEVYPLAITLADGQFIPLSIWTWASFSYKGGKGVPGPLSLHVERDWFSREILERTYAALEENWTIDELIIDLMGRGSESADLAEFILPVQQDSKELFVETCVQPVYPEAGQLKRFQGNPILSPVKEHDWESTYVLNSAAIRLGGKIYLLYRAFGDQKVSSIGLAVTNDGFHISERLPEPIFVPETQEESAGVEDPRIVRIGDRLYMTYTAYDGVVPQIALASISVDDFLARRWEKWERLGLAFPNFPNKDAVIFPEKINGRYAMYHRVAPSIWLSYADSIQCPWPKTGHKIIMGPRYGMLWDAIKIGAGAQPLKTRHGWLLIYHGVDYAIHYSLGVMLVSLDDPSNLIYRSPNPILTPEEEYEKGVKGQVWVPNVVFTCGAVPARDTDLLEDDDEVLVYYGAADTFIGVAKATVAELIPEPIRKQEKSWKK